jgi:AAA+ ATPase superfamily predicted ATPase
MTHQIYKTNSVYGISRELPLNYVEREEVDQRLVDNLTKDKHIVIYGSSKQGKTSLRKHCLETDDYIIIQCSNRWGLVDIQSAILKGAGYQITQSIERTASGANKIKASLEAGSSLFNIIKGQISGEIEEGKATKITLGGLEIDAEDVNDIIAALKEIKFNKYIVLEDFHYLSIEAQKDFAVALKAFHEASELCFIIIGVWLEENRLIVYNGDLTGRVVAIDADKWTDEELIKVIDEGAKLLNIKFTNYFKSVLLRESYDSVYIVQEVCLAACIKEKIRETQNENFEIGNNLDISELVKTVVNQQSGRYISFITQFSEGFQDTRLEMYKWLLFPILTTSLQELQQGLSYARIREVLQAKHPSGKDLNPGNLTQALQSVASLQVKKEIKPIILDYDQTNRRLNIVDRGFFIWRANQNIKELLEAADLS